MIYIYLIGELRDKVNYFCLQDYLGHVWIGKKRETERQRDWIDLKVPEISHLLNLHFSGRTIGIYCFDITVLFVYILAGQINLLFVQRRYLIVGIGHWT